MSYLRSVRIRNFKAIRDSGLVKLDALTVFIGNNGAGKSSLALQLFQSVVLDGVDAAFEPFNGIEHARHKSARTWRAHAVADPTSQRDPVSLYFRARVPAVGQVRSRMMLNVREAGLQYIQEERYEYSHAESIRDF